MCLNSSLTSEIQGGKKDFNFFNLLKGQENSFFKFLKNKKDSYLICLDLFICVFY